MMIDRWKRKCEHCTNEARLYIRHGNEEIYLCEFCLIPWCEAILKQFNEWRKRNENHEGKRKQYND